MTKLETITAEDLQNRTYEPTHFLADELIPEGLHILAGAPKIGKSWLALWLCLCVAQGQALWNFATTQGEVLYLSLEDSFQRIQTRLFDLTEDAPPTLHFAIMADTLKHGLEQQIEQFLAEHPTTKLVVIDTLQRVRGTGSDSNLYANDYQDIGLLKKLADKRHIAILLIHHLRKLHDDDPMNMISGSTGLSGAADSTFVLQKHSRLANIASLHCTGRDIPDRTLKLEFGIVQHSRSTVSGEGVQEGKTKNGRTRTVSMNEEMFSLLRGFCYRKMRLRDEHGIPFPEYIFTKDDGTPIHPDTFSKHLKALFAEIGLPKTYHLHTLRHFFVSTLLHEGVDKNTVADLAGHGDTSFLERTYCHPQMQLKQEAAKRMSNSLFATPNPELLVS